jgi:hypothetical protein
VISCAGLRAGSAPGDEGRFKLNVIEVFLVVARYDPTWIFLEEPRWRSFVKAPRFTRRDFTCFSRRILQLQIRLHSNISGIRGAL